MKLIQTAVGSRRKHIISHYGREQAGFSYGLCGICLQSAYCLIIRSLIGDEYLLDDEDICPDCLSRYLGMQEEAEN